MNFSLALCVSLNSSCRSLSCWYTSDISSSANMCSGISMFIRNLARYVRFCSSGSLASVRVRVTARARARGRGRGRARGKE